MAQTVIGFFDNMSEAQNAVQQLLSNGFTRESVDLSTGNNSGTVSAGRSDNDGNSGNGVSRFFKSLFGDDNDEAEKYSQVGQRSGSIVTVHARSTEEAERAADLLDDYGAINVNERAAEYGYSSTRNESGVNTSDRLNVDSDREASIPRIQENLEVGKRTVESGGVRVRSRVVERPVEESIRLREEHVRVERNPVDRPISGADITNFQEGEIELRERAEVPVVNKEARVVEEVRISKEASERNETIRDTVRNTEIDIENLDSGERRENLNRDGEYGSSRNSSL